MTHQDFWERYFYKVYQLQEDEKRKADLKNRADKLKQDDSEQAWEGNDYIFFIQFSGLLLRYSTALQECSMPITVHVFEFCVWFATIQLVMLQSSLG